MTTASPKKVIMAVLACWATFFAIWLAQTASFDPAALASGLVLTFVTALLAVLRGSFWSGLDLKPGRLLGGIQFLALFLKEMILSNVMLLRYVYAPRVKIAPAVVRVPIAVTGPRERLALTNTIALTPGTLAIDLQARHVDVHVLDEVLAEGVPASVARFEKFLEKAVG